VAVAACPSCQLRLEGRFEFNEFSALGHEDLHFLRIFVHTEGSIREMEAALGLSYPTIKARLAELRSRLAAASQASPAAMPPPDPPSPFQPDRPARSREARQGPDPIDRLLDALEAGQVSPTDAIDELRGNRK
jgi:hypothetical protein